MFINLFLILIAAVFAVQLLACIKGRTTFQRLLPLIVLCVLEATCWGFYHYAATNLIEVDGAAFAAWLMALVVLILMIVDGFAWGSYAGVRFAQKRRKNFVL